MEHISFAFIVLILVGAWGYNKDPDFKAAVLSRLNVPTCEQGVRP